MSRVGQDGSIFEQFKGLISFYFLELLEIQNNRSKWLDKCQLLCFVGILRSPFWKLGTEEKGNLGWVHSVGTSGSLLNCSE